MFQCLDCWGLGVKLHLTIDDDGTSEGGVLSPQSEVFLLIHTL